MKILVYGMGGSATKFIKRMRGTEYSVVGVTDNTATKDGSTFEGVPVLSLKEGVSFDFDRLVICALGHEKEVWERLNNFNYDMQKVIVVSEFYRLYLFREKHEKLLERNELYQFFCKEKHTSMEKWFHYFDVYDTFFHKFRDTDIVICEIGVCKGGSVQMWKHYFGERATIIGIDINEECRKYEEDHIHIEIGSQEDKKFWEYIKRKYPRIDILLDDGGHTMTQQIVTFESMFPHISDGGIYLCEDCHTSYWKEYGGGYKREGTFIEYSKDWIDEVNGNYFHQPEELSYNTMHIAGLHYYDSMVVIEKDYTDFPFCITLGE